VMHDYKYDLERKLYGGGDGYADGNGGGLG
jgi:hypothetical protein